MKRFIVTLKEFESMLIIKKLFHQWRRFVWGEIFCTIPLDARIAFFLLIFLRPEEN